MEEQEKQEKKPREALRSPPKRRSIVPRVLVGGAVAVLGVWLALYSAQLGRGPWAWTGEEWRGFATFSRQQVEQAKLEATRQLEKVDWDKVWDKLPEVKQKLADRLAELRDNRKAPPAQPGGAAGEAQPGDQPGAQPAMVEPPPPSQLELGLEAMQEGIRHYQESRDSQAKLRKAKERFQTAQQHLEAAYDEARGAGSPAQMDEIEGYLSQIQIYLLDCSKREIVGR